MKFSIVAGATSQTIDLYIQKSTDNTPMTGLVYNSTGLTCSYNFPRGASTAVTLATLASPTAAYSSGGFKEIDATNQPGHYRFDIPNALLASGNGRYVKIVFRGVTNMADLVVEIELTGWDNQLVPGTAGGMLVVGTTTGTITVTDGVVVNRSSANSDAVTFTGNGTGAGLRIVGGGNNGNGIYVSATGSGTGLYCYANGDGGTAALFEGTGNGAVGMAIWSDTSGPGLYIFGADPVQPAVLIESNGAGGPGLWIVTTNGADGVSIAPTGGHGVKIQAQGASKHGVTITGGTAGTSDGLKCVAGTGGVDIRGNLTGNVTGNLSGSVGSLTTNNDKTGYSLTVTPPTSAQITTAVLTTAMTESYAANGAAPTLAQILFQIWSFLSQESIVSTTVTCKKLDGSTTAMTLTLNDPANPTSITRAS
jgi:hypothetical protein